MKKRTTNLGRFLQVARERKSFTLRAVERATKISNAYLSQLESGKIGQPSPVFLHQLSELYKVSYAEVLQLAGYPVPEREGNPSSRQAARFGLITRDEEKALEEYLDFLRSKKTRAR